RRQFPVASAAGQPERASLPTSRAVGPWAAEIRWAGPAGRPTIERMPRYEPVDLSDACNAGVEVLGDASGDVPLGRVDLRGLPFLIGPERPSAERCYVLPGVAT